MVGAGLLLRSQHRGGVQLAKGQVELQEGPQLRTGLGRFPGNKGVKADRLAGFPQRGVAQRRLDEPGSRFFHNSVLLNGHDPAPPLDDPRSDPGAGDGRPGHAPGDLDAWNARSPHGDAGAIVRRPWGQRRVPPPMQRRFAILGRTALRGDRFDQLVAGTAIVATRRIQALTCR